MNGIELIAAERQRQIDVEAYSFDHDGHHVDESLALAACSYAIPHTWRRFKSANEPGGPSVPTTWPWGARYWKPGADTVDGRIRELVKAGALIAAEIDRLAASDRSGPS
jgi:hypothetical protein